MDSPARRLILPFLLAASLTHVAFGQTPSRDPLGAARDLYASARYDEALAVLNDMRPAEPTGSDLKSIEQYRSLCLLALGRGTEAETAIAAVVTADPSYQPGDAEASPRVRAAFSDVRKRLLPEIARARYAEAKATFDKKDYARATAQFKQVLVLLDDPDMGGKQGDMRTLTQGFLDLAIAATPPPEPPKPVPAPAPAPAPEPVVPQPDPNRIYTMNDTDVVPPTIVRQDLPRLTPLMKPQAKDHGIVEVVIDEQGRVTQVAVRQSIQPMYDAELLAKGREWRYTPATLNGKPVRYRKLIQLNVNRE